MFNLSKPMLENKIELLEEDIEAFHMNLDDLGIPRKDENGQRFSMWGRTALLLKKNNIESI